LSLRLLLDEDSQAKYLLNLLIAAEHDVVTVNAMGLTNRPDAVVLEFARKDQRVLLTRNCDDFLQLHQLHPEHAGILVVYQDMDPAKNMSYQQIVSAIANPESAEYTLQNQFVVLNQWNY